MRQTLKMRKEKQNHLMQIRGKIDRDREKVCVWWKYGKKMKCWLAKKAKNENKNINGKLKQTNNIYNIATTQIDVCLLRFCENKQKIFADLMQIEIGYFNFRMREKTK